MLLLFRKRALEESEERQRKEEARRKNQRREEEKREEILEKRKRKKGREEDKENSSRRVNKAGSAGEELYGALRAPGSLRGEEEIVDPDLYINENIEKNQKKMKELAEREGLVNPYQLH